MSICVIITSKKSACLNYSQRCERRERDNKKFYNGLISLCRFQFLQDFGDL